MSVDILRKAAELMRERAEAATPGPWHNRRGPGEHVVAEFEGVATVNSLHPREDRRHIASWHPTVTAAVAEWLAECARLWEYGDVGPLMWQHANTVARAYLGEATDV